MDEGRSEHGLGEGQGVDRLGWYSGSSRKERERPQGSEQADSSSLLDRLASRATCWDLHARGQGYGKPDP